MLMDEWKRRLFGWALKVVPTCDLQFALSLREGVTAHRLRVGDVAELALGNAAGRRITGPCTITVNVD